jgi:hypothetical protein
MLWEGMAGRGWTELVQQWGVPQMEALQLQKSIASLMREIGPRLGDLHWKESTRLGRESRVLPEEAMGMLEAARTARRLREPGWCGEKGQGRWQAKKLLEWAAKELTTSRRDLELQFGDVQDWAQRETMERRMGDSLLRWLGLDKPPQHRVRHKVWKKQLADNTRQLKLQWVLTGQGRGLSWRCWMAQRCSVRIMGLERSLWQVGGVAGSSCKIGCRGRWPPSP